MKYLVFDSGPLISMTMNNLLYLLKPMKQRFKGKFVITNAVKEELVDNPLKSKRFKFEALQINALINDKVLEVVDYPELEQQTRDILDCANESFFVKQQPLRIIQYAEASVLALSLHWKAEAIMVDERVTRALVETPTTLLSLIKRRFRSKVKADNSKLRFLQEKLKNIKVLRSVDFATVAFERGLLDNYLTHVPSHLTDPKKVLLDGVLWGLKIDGSAISKEDIDYIIRKVLS